jgi:hypothetical protein
VPGCQLVKAKGMSNSSCWAAACCLQASNPDSSRCVQLFEQESLWLSIVGWNVHQVARVSSGTHIGHFVPRRSRNGLLVVTFLTMKIKRYLLLISYCYWMYNVVVKIYRWFSMCKPICQIIQLRLGSLKYLYIAEMACLVRLAACS